MLLVSCYNTVTLPNLFPLANEGRDFFSPGVQLAGHEKN